MTKVFKKVFLVILDGFGLDREGQGNAILQAGMPYMNSLVAEYPAMNVAASGLIVGLPWGEPGNSEVGHSAIGTGRIIIQDLAWINNAIRTEEFFQNQAFLEAAAHCKQNDSQLHLIGCVSPGGIHSHEEHLFALLRFAKRQGLKKVLVHMITDGQDMPPQDALNSLKRLEPVLKETGAKLASVHGRTYAMDRVLNWPLTALVWSAFVDGEGPPISNVEEYLKQSYQQGVFDHEILPAVVTDEGKPVATLKDNDGVIFFNFRNDRMKQLVRSFVLADFQGFQQKYHPKNLFLVTMTRYADEYPVRVAYEAVQIENTLGDIVSRNGLAQYRIAEKEKEAHVTNFFNGGRISALPLEERVITSSRPMKGSEYLEHPEMSAETIFEEVSARMNEDKRLFVINFANADMIGHTGNLNATIAAMKILDELLSKMLPAITADPEHVVLITADHGNAEELIDPQTGGEDTQHSTRNVPVIFVAQELKGQGTGKDLQVLANENPIGTLIDIAPSVLALLGFEKPKEMTGSTLI